MWKISWQYLVGVCAASVQWFPKDNCKPDIWCRLVPFIWAGVVGWVVIVHRFPSDDLKHNTFHGWAPFSPEIPPPHFWTLYFVVTISITSQQNVCEEKKVIEQFQLFIFGTEVLISLISSLGGWWGCGWVVFLAKGTTSRTLVFLISDKKKEPPN